MPRLILTARSSEVTPYDTESNPTFSVVRDDSGAPVTGLAKDNISVAFTGQPAEVTYLEDYGFGFYYVNVDWRVPLPQGWPVAGVRPIMLMVREFEDDGSGGKGTVTSSGRMVLPLVIEPE